MNKKAKGAFNFRPCNIPSFVLNSEQPLIQKGFGEQSLAVIAVEKCASKCTDYPSGFYFGFPHIAYFGETNYTKPLFYDHIEESLEPFPDREKGLLINPHNELSARKLPSNLLNKLKQ